MMKNMFICKKNLANKIMGKGFPLWVYGIFLPVSLAFMIGCETQMDPGQPVPSIGAAALPAQTPPPPTPSPTTLTEGENQEIESEILKPVYSYNAEGRRDPFSSILLVGKKMGGDLLPPLQRVELSQLQLIGVVWGNFGYNGMLQSSDGKGYTVRAGTIVGQNQGVVKEITPQNLIVQETFTDIFGEKKTRDFVFQLHPQEDFE